MTNTGKIWSSTVDDCLWVSWSVESLNRSDILNEYPAPTKITRMPVTNTTLMVSVWKKTVWWKPMCDMVCLNQGWISGVNPTAIWMTIDYGTNNIFCSRCQFVFCISGRIFPPGAVCLAWVWCQAKRKSWFKALLCFLLKSGSRYKTCQGNVISGHNSAQWKLLCRIAVLNCIAYVYAYMYLCIYTCISYVGKVKQYWMARRINE